MTNQADWLRRNKFIGAYVPAETAQQIDALAPESKSAWLRSAIEEKLSKEREREDA